MNTSARVSVPPNATIAGLSNVTGSDWVQEKVGDGLTTTAADRVVDPPVPVQAMLYVVLTVGETETDPETPVGEKPVPLQAVALVDDHESVEEAPEAMRSGLVPNESIGVVGDAAARALWWVHAVRSSLKATSHHVIESALTGPPITVPWFPCASTPIAGVPVAGVDEG
jgi:hypothetical protein